MGEAFGDFSSAVSDFHLARRKAALEMLLARFRGKSNDLLPYEDVRQKLKATAITERGLHDIPIAAIVGSVGRYTDFTRSFLPKQNTDRSRWARVKVASASMEGLPPIEVYRIGETYFVKDGNHRVSIARELGSKFIQAYVTEVRTKVSLTPDIQPDELIIKAEYAGFLARTRIDDLCPGVDLSVTAPGQYEILEEHIQVHRYYMGLDMHRHITAEEATVHWYKEVYLPIVHIIRRHHLLYEFPERTETDLYLWLSDHREALKSSLGWDIDPDVVADDLAHRFGSTLTRVISRIGEKLLEFVTPAPLEPGPPPGVWREKRQERERENLFHDILVPLNGKESGWQALGQAIEIARREGCRLYGLYVVSSAAQRESKRTVAVKAEFERRCEAAHISGRLALETGPVARTIIARARWADLLVVSLNYPPGSGLIAKLRSGFRLLVQGSPTPVLAIPRSLFPLTHALLAYDGSPKSQEALFLTTYLAARWRGFALTVLTVGEEARARDPHLAYARGYLMDHGVEATYRYEQAASAADAIIATAVELHSDLIIMGSYSRGALLEVFLGSAVNKVLREGQRPVLICR